MSQAGPSGEGPGDLPLASARISFVIKRLQTVIGSRIEEALRPLDLTPAQYTLLSIVARRPRLSAAQLARRLQVRAPTMNEVVTPLARKKLIARQEDPNNRRVLRISITPKGSDLLARCDALTDGVEAEFFGRLPQSRIDAFRQAALEILRAADPHHGSRQTHEAMAADPAESGPPRSPPVLVPARRSARQPARPLSSD